MTDRSPFRAEALAALQTPDQLGHVLRLVKPARAWALGVLGGAIVMAVAAAAIVRVPIPVKAAGVLASSKGVLELPITAQHEGRIAAILVQHGDHVAPDDVIARLELPELRAEFALAEADRRQVESELERIRLIQKGQAEGVRGLNEQNRAEIQSGLRSLGDRLAALRDMREGLDKLRDRGIVSLDRALQIRSDLADTEERMAAKRSELLRMDLDERNQASQFQREVFALESRLAAADRQLARLREQLKRELVLSSHYGVVSEIAVAAGDLVKFDTPVVSLLPTDRTLSSETPGPDYLLATLFVPAAEGKKVRPGMEVLIDPRSVRRDVYGYMIGTVRSVSDVPTTVERLRRLLRNDALARQLSQEGAPFLVQVVLRRERSNPSGFAWTSSKGPEVRITAGTLLAADIATERVTLLSLALPALRALMRTDPGAGARREQ